MNMKKIVMSLVMALFAMSAMAANIKWWTKSAEENLADLGQRTTSQFANAPDQTRGNQVMFVGINGNASVEYNNTVMTLAQWSSLMPTSSDEYGEYSLGAMRIRIGDRVLQAYLGDGDWYDCTTEVFFDGDGGGYWQPGGDPGGYQVGMLTDADLSATAFFELGIMDDDTWEFTALAFASKPVSELWDDYTYPPGTLYPLDEGIWRPDYFHAVPEPSTAILALLGTCLLLKRRKSVCA